MKPAAAFVGSFRALSMLPLVTELSKSSGAETCLVALYDAQGVLRCAGADPEECLAYASLFDLDPASCSLVSLN